MSDPDVRQAVGRRDGGTDVEEIAVGRCCVRIRKGCGLGLRRGEGEGRESWYECQGRECRQASCDPVGEHVASFREMGALWLNDQNDVAFSQPRTRTLGMRRESAKFVLA